MVTPRRAKVSTGRMAPAGIAWHRHRVQSTAWPGLGGAEMARTGLAGSGCHRIARPRKATAGTYRMGKPGLVPLRPKTKGKHRMVATRIVMAGLQGTEGWRRARSRTAPHCPDGIAWARIVLSGTGVHSNGRMVGHRIAKVRRAKSSHSSARAGRQSTAERRHGRQCFVAGTASQRQECNGWHRSAKE